MNNEIAPVLDMLEELKQECKAISKAQVELRTTIAEQLSNPKGDSIKTHEAVQIHLSKETQAKIKEHQIFVLEALLEFSKKLDPKFEALQQLISKQQKPVEYKNYSLFASVQLAERMLLLLVCGLVIVSCWFFGMGATSYKQPPITTYVIDICVCVAKLPLQTLHILTAYLSYIAIPKLFNRCNRRLLITSKPCSGKPNCCCNKSISNKSKEN